MVTPPPARGGVTEAGFTLLEMLAVLVLLGLFLGLVTPILGRGSDAARLRGDTRGLATALATARGEAIVRGREATFVVDLDARVYGLEGTVDGRLDAGTRVDLLVGETEVRDRRAAIRFMPDGRSSGGEIRLGNGAGESVLRIDWLTGRVH